MDSKIIIDKTILNTFNCLMEDYLADKYKYFSEADVVCSFAWLFENQKTIFNLNKDRNIDFHLEYISDKYRTKADFAIRMNDLTSRWSLNNVIEFKIRISGNKERTLLDLKKVRTLNAKGISSYLMILDRCAREQQIREYINQEINSDDSIRNKILWVSSEMGKTSVLRRGTHNPNDDDILKIKNIFSEVIRSVKGLEAQNLTESDTTYGLYAKLLSHPEFKILYDNGFVDMHLELRPYKKDGKKDLIIDNKTFSWAPQYRKNEGARIDFTITRRNEQHIQQALQKAKTDQGGNMKYWRILSNPLENIIIFCEIKHGNNINKDLEKLRVLKNTLPECDAYQIYKEKQTFKFLKYGEDFS